MSAAAWPTFPMGEIAPLVRRPIQPKPDELYRQIGIRSFGNGVFHKAPTTGLDIGSKRVFSVEPGDLLFNIVFAWEGATAVATETERGMIGSHRFLTCVTDRTKVDARFLNYWFMQAESREQLLRASPGGAGRNRTLGIEKLAAIHVPLPPIDEQRRIVMRIQELTGKVEDSDQLRREAAAATNALPISTRARVFERLSSGARRVPLTEASTTRLGKMLNPGAKTGIGTTPYLRNANVQWDRLDLASVFTMDFSKDERIEFSLRRDDLLVCEGGDIGKAAIWNDEIPGACFQKALHRVRCDQSILLPRFLLHHLFWAAEAGHWDELKTQTTIAHLTGVKLRSYGIVLPTLDVQEEAVAELDALQAKVDALKSLQVETAAKLDAMLPAILDTAFKGEL